MTPNILELNVVILNVVMLSVVTPCPLFVNKCNLSNSLWAHLSLNYYEIHRFYPQKVL
jgi:hypothetical protein